MTKNKHLSLYNRIIINNSLNAYLGFKAIAKKSVKTVISFPKKLEKIRFFLSLDQI